jgi:hypothetical protein
MVFLILFYNNLSTFKLIFDSNRFNRKIMLITFLSALLVNCANRKQETLPSNLSNGAGNTVTPSSVGSCTLADRQTVSAGTFSVISGFTAAAVPYGQTCVADTYQGTCTSGTATYSHQPAAALCTVGATPSSNNCTVNNVAVSQGSFNIAYGYTTTSVPYGQTCVADSFQGTCASTGGVTYSHLPAANTCTVNAAPAASNCTVNNISVAQGTFNFSAGYTSTSVPYGQSCVADSYQGTCTNGTPTYTHQPVATACAPQTIFNIISTVSGALSNYSVKIDMTFNSADNNAAGAVFLVAYINSQYYVCTNGCTNNQWVLFNSNSNTTDWSLSGLRSAVGISNSGTTGLQTIYNYSSDLTSVGGAEVYAGYGLGNSTSAALTEMMNYRSTYFSSGRIIKVLTVPYQNRSISINGPNNSSPGSLTSYNLMGYIYPSSADYGQPGYFFVYAHNPINTIKMVLRYSASNNYWEWVSWDGNTNTLSDKYFKYDSAIKNEVFTIVQGNVTDFQNWKVYVGYGNGATTAEAATNCMDNNKFNTTGWTIQ